MVECDLVEGQFLEVNWFSKWTELVEEEELLRAAKKHYGDGEYNLYLKQPDRPADSYIDKLYRRYSIRVSRSFISRWFRNISPFKGTMRKTSKFPPRKFSKRNNKLLIEFFKIKKYTPDHRKFVFADEKPMKEIDVYGEVHRDPITGEVPVQQCEANSKNRYNILSSVCLKKCT